MKSVSLTALGRTLMVAAAVTACAWSGAAFAQSSGDKPTAAVYVMGNHEDSDFVKKAIINYMVRNSPYRVVDIDAVGTLLNEHMRQESPSAQQIANYGKDAGAMYVCVVEITERRGKTYVTTRMVETERKIATYSEMATMSDSDDILKFVEKQVFLMLKSSKG